MRVVDWTAAYGEGIQPTQGAKEICSDSACLNNGGHPHTFEVSLIHRLRTCCQIRPPHALSTPILHVLFTRHAVLSNLKTLHSKTRYLPSMWPLSAPTTSTLNKAFLREGLGLVTALQKPNIAPSMFGPLQCCHSLCRIDSLEHLHFG